MAELAATEDVRWWSDSEVAPFSVSTVIWQGFGSSFESCHAASDGYLCSVMNGGRVAKFDWDGSPVDFPGANDLDEPRGLALSLSKTTLFVASNDRVTEYALSSTGATEVRHFDTSVFGVPRPNGLCLDEGGQKLYATQPGWKAMPWGATEELSALLQIDLETGDVSSLFHGIENQSPNGCAVEGDTIWMIGMRHGVTSFDLPSLEAHSTRAFSSAIAEAENSLELAGDGIAFYGGKMYVSIWKPMGEGRIYECEAATDAPCTRLDTNIRGADIQVDDHDPEHPALLVPDLSSSPWGQVRAVALPRL